MNTKIYHLIEKNLLKAFNLPKYSDIRITPSTAIQDLPWTPSRYSKFKLCIENELQLRLPDRGTLSDVVHELSEQYLMRFFSEIWKPKTDSYVYTGWQLADEINKLNPRSVLDVGCGYNPFKGRINNIIGIDPYNNCADYMVDVLDYTNMHDVIIALGSINFNDKQEIELRFSHCVSLLEPGGRMYIRANPGIPHANGPYVDIFPWTFEVVNEFAQRYNLKLLEFKKEPAELGRLYFVYTKL